MLRFIFTSSGKDTEVLRGMGDFRTGRETGGTLLRPWTTVNNFLGHKNF
jgi:hypothetical protein